MKKILAVILCAALLTAVFPLAIAVYATEGNQKPEMLDEIIIEFFDKAQFPGKEKQYDDEVEKVIKDGLSVVCKNVYVVKAEGLSKNPNAVLNRFKNSKFIKNVEPNYTVNCDIIPTDPNYKSYQSAAMNLIDAPAGWDISIGNNSPIIAVIDSGIAKHPDLPAVVNSYSSVSSLAPSNDKLGHGTKVAGVIGAMNNTVGGVGINWNASIMSVKVDDANGNISVANLAIGIMWAADNGAKVINMSLGTVSDSVTLKNAVDYAYKAGCAMFAATGNESAASVCYPARYANVFGVGGTTNGTSRVSTSNYGSGIDVVAIGTFYATTASGSYVSSVGTSFSSPQAAGLASLMLALDPGLTNDKIYSLIREGAKPLGGGYNEQTGYGLIDIAKTLELVEANTTPQIIKDAIPPILTLNGDEVMEVGRGNEYIEPGYTAVDNVDGDITGKVVVTGSVNVNVPGVYRLEYKVSDAAGNASAATRVVEVVEVNSAPPVLTLDGMQTMLVEQGSAFVEPGYTAISDIDGDITDRVTVAGSVDINAPGVYKLEYRVTDTAGNTVAATRSVEVAAPAPLPEPQYTEQNPPASFMSGEKSFLIEAATGDRNNYSGSVGYEFECIKDMSVSTVGRPLNGSMKHEHTVYIWDVSTTALLASAEVRPDSPLDNLGFKTAHLDKTITLKAGGKYRIVSSETAGGDSWYDVDQTYNLIPTADCKITTPAFTGEGANDLYPTNQWDPGGIKGYTGVTFYYIVESSAPPTGPAETPTEPVETPPEPAETPTEPAETPTEPVDTPPEPLETPQITEYKTPPIITLKGAMETSLYTDDQYVEAGYKAVDFYGVDLTSAVSVTGNVKTLKPGIYTVNYEVKDAGGNSARATRTVIVEEREAPPPLPTAPTLTIIGSDPIILHLDSGTPYTEQGANAYDEIDGDISGSVQITGNFDRNRDGTYILTYKVVNSAGLDAVATREVHILAPNVVKLPQQTFNFSGQGKAVSTNSHKNISIDDAGWVDFSITSLDKNMVVEVEVTDQNYGDEVYSDTYTGVGGTQFWADEGVYCIDVTISSGNGNCKYGLKIVTPDSSYFSFDDEEIPFSNPETIRYLIGDGYSPLEICLRDKLSPDELNEYYDDFVTAGWTDSDLEWFGLEMTISDIEAPLAGFQSEEVITYVVSAGDNLSRIAEKTLGDRTRWLEIYKMNKDVIGRNPNLICPGLVLRINVTAK